MRQWIPAILIALVALLGGTLIGQPTTLLLKVEAPPQPWGDSDLYGKLTVRLSRDPSFRIVRADDNLIDVPGFPADRWNLDSLVDWGQEAGGRYLLMVTVESERIVREKPFSIPLIAGMYQTRGIITGEYRLVDVVRGRLLKAEAFEVRIDGPRILQGSMDDDKYDPDIHLSAVEKLAFIGQLEDKLADQLTGMFFYGIRHP